MNKIEDNSKKVFNSSKMLNNKPTKRIQIRQESFYRSTQPKFLLILAKEYRMCINTKKINLKWKNYIFAWFCFGSRFWFRYKNEKEKHLETKCKHTKIYIKYI